MIFLIQPVVISVIKEETNNRIIQGDEHLNMYMYIINHMGAHRLLQVLRVNRTFEKY